MWSTSPANRQQLHRFAPRICFSQAYPYVTHQTSLPVRGRGSKPDVVGSHRPEARSLPVRGRGSKQPWRAQHAQRHASLPVRGRGSKLFRADRANTGAAVAPRAGAWIETSRLAPSMKRISVAPRAGAWIETRVSRLYRQQIPRRSPCGGVDRNMLDEALFTPNTSSLPVRGRGSKLIQPARIVTRANVAPRAGAWIETGSLRLFPLRTRVAPRAGAWIETLRTHPDQGKSLVAPRAGAWIETGGTAITLPRTPGSLPVRGRGSKQCQLTCEREPRLSLPVRGRGSKHLGRLYRRQVARSLPVRGRGSKL